MRVILSIVFVALLAGCSTYAGKSKLRDHANLEDYNPQNFQGCTVGQYKIPDIATRETGDTDNKGLAPGATITWWDCKDKAHVSGKMDLTGDGKPDFEYRADDVDGSTAAKIRADLEARFAEAGVEGAGKAACLAMASMGIPCRD
ncbi:MAG: hypothetical protein WD750_05950 [Gammaproteobacteria bacterium]